MCSITGPRHLLFLMLPFVSIPPLDYIKRLRYCEYLGRYFCQCCHENAQAVVPGRVLRKWDFSKYYVSNFARDLLSKIAGDPLFNPSDINSGLYKKIKALEAVRVSTPGGRGAGSCTLASHFFTVLLKQYGVLVITTHI